MDIHTRFEQEHLPATVHAVAGGSAAFLSVRAPGKETENEDALALISLDGDRGVLIVADGLGGHAEGALASRLAVESLIAELRHPEADDNELRTAILRGIDRANHAILERGTGAATTLVIAEINGDVLRTYHVGDSLLLVTGQQGRLKFQSIPHSPVGYAVEAGMLDETEAMEATHRHIVSNVVGSQDMRVEMGPRLKLAPFDTVVLASDGLSDNLVTHEIIEGVRRGPLGDGIEGLYAACSARMAGGGHPDDLTVILFRRRS